ncbi:MAG TPA: hypothetical protein VH331_05275 [Allosphingosinicella sp.]|jgi:hypothetical protein|nr:hypothetical protein [Allosphingosinicella sp.]
MRTLLGLTVLALSTAACSAESARLPDGAVILDGKMARAVLQQCSRDVPAIGEATWQPDAQQIRDLEAALPRALKSDRTPGNPYLYGPAYTKAGPDWSKAPSDWRRQYVGLIRHGRRFIYGNFFPERDSEEFRNWKTEPALICDGGPSFFGAEYDPNSGRFTHFAFNGVA